MDANNKPRLVLPSIKYVSSYLDASAELRATDRRDTDEAQIQTQEQFVDYIELLESNQEGLSLKPGHVRSREYWLVKGDKYIGRIGIRDSRKEDPNKDSTGNIGYLIRPSERKKGYGKLLFQLGIDKARNMGFEELLVVVNESNIASRKIIEANGGIFVHTTNPNLKHQKYHYRIQL